MAGYLGVRQSNFCIQICILHCTAICGRAARAAYSGSGIVEQCGPDEWLICVEDDRLATREDGTPPRPGDPSDSLLYPRCFREPRPA